MFSCLFLYQRALVLVKVEMLVILLITQLISLAAVVGAERRKEGVWSQWNHPIEDSIALGRCSELIAEIVTSAPSFPTSFFSASLSLNNRKLLSHSPGGEKSKISQSAGRVGSFSEL